MQVGVGLPTFILGTPGSRIAEWARAAEAAGFVSLSCTDRLTYESLDQFASLAVAATVTEHVTLRTAVLLGPLRATALLAKSALTLDRLSAGRFELGMAAGTRQRDYDAVGVDFHRRGRILDQQIAGLIDIWLAGEDRTGGAVGPAPFTKGGPRLMFGGTSDATWRRVAAYGAGWICGHGSPEQFDSWARELDKVWAGSGRQGRPRRLMAVYFALGGHGPARVRSHLDRYYGDVPFKETLYAASPKSSAELNKVLDDYAAVGCDEMILYPCASGIEQIELLATTVPVGYLGR